MYSSPTALASPPILKPKSQWHCSFFMKRGIRYTGIPLWWNSLGQSWSGQCQEGLEQMKIRLFLHVFMAIHVHTHNTDFRNCTKKIPEDALQINAAISSFSPRQMGRAAQDINLVFNPIFYTIDRVISCVLSPCLDGFFCAKSEQQHSPERPIQSGCTFGTLPSSLLSASQTGWAQD